MVELGNSAASTASGEASVSSTIGTSEEEEKPPWNAR